MQLDELAPLTLGKLRQMFGNSLPQQSDFPYLFWVCLVLLASNANVDPNVTLSRQLGLDLQIDVPTLEVFCQ